MNSRAFTLSLTMALIAMMMVYSYMEGEKKKFTQEYGNEVPVIVAIKDIKEFDVIDDRKVTVKKVPKRFRMPGSFRTVKEIENNIALTPILKGEQITRPRVSVPGASTGLSRQISPDMRALSIQISDGQAVSKLIKPGDRVDLLMRIDYAGGRKDLQELHTVMQDVLVLSTGLSVTNSVPLVMKKQGGNDYQKVNLNRYTNYNTVTLELTPIDAQKLIFLIEVTGARPYLTLRNGSDKSKPKVDPLKLYDVLNSLGTSREAKSYFDKFNSRRGGGGR